MITKTKALAVAVAALVVIAACGGDDSSTTTTGAPVTDAPATDPPETEAPDTSGPEATTTEPAATDPPPPDDGITRGGTFVYGIPSYPEPLHPLTLFASSGTNISMGIYDTLLDIDASGAIQPRLAESIESDDGATWVLTLREGVRFSDGQDFDAEAVVTHFEVIIDPANECECLSRVSNIVDVEATGSHEVTITLSQPSASFPSLLTDTVGMVPAPGSTPENPVGAGAFILDEVRVDESIRVVANPDFFIEGQPYLDAVVYQVVPDPATRLAALQAGDIHLYWEATNANWAGIESSPDTKMIVFGGFGSTFMLLNHVVAPFDDPVARLAVAKALDLETLHETINAGVVEPATSIFARNSWAYPGEIEDYPTYDLDGARELVGQLGGLQFEIIVPQLIYQQAVAVQGMLQEAGMEVEVTTGENLTMIGRMREGDYQAAYSAYSGGLDPYTFTSRYHSQNPANYSNYANPDMDALVDQADVVLGQDDRKAIFAEIAQLAAVDLPFLVVNNYNNGWAARANLMGIPTTPDGIVRPAGAWLDS